MTRAFPILVIVLLAGCGKPAMRVSGVPVDLILPLPEGTNTVVTAEVQGGRVRSAWIAEHEGSPLRVMLTRVDEHTYQINLATGELTRLLDEGRLNGELFIFAEIADGRLLASVPIQYALPADDTPPEVLVVSTAGRASAACPTWVVPDKVERIDLRCAGGVRGASARATCGVHDWPFSPEGPNTLRLALAPDMRQAWVEQGSLDVRHKLYRRSEKTVASLKSAPVELDVADGVLVTVYQRETRPIPASRGFLELTLGDITAGQVLVSVQTVTGEVLIDRVSVHQGDVLELPFGCRPALLVVESLFNFLTGQDYAVLRILPASSWERHKIERLLAILEKSDIIFIRNDQEFSSAQAASHLREKLQAFPGVTTVEDFIEHIASRSSLSQEPYRIRLPDGTTLEAGVWMRQQSLPQPPSESPAPASRPAPAETHPQ